MFNGKNDASDNLRHASYLMAGFFFVYQALNVVNAAELLPQAVDLELAKQGFFAFFAVAVTLVKATSGKVFRKTSGTFESEETD